MPEALLTSDEHKALALSADLANLIAKIIKAGDDADASRFDWAEAAHDIHHIQHLIMAQAAARAYPNELRLLGSRLDGPDA